ncbi:multidrug ABC transporter ATP-binding protein [Pseudidiomarina atlantica]|jgi:ribosome-dependent ATPase|uniref:Multidrug ABC transporter ATP-binding protein n=1 Tax=Pseudidiomarina atlantica TaxID=1517416 RepID=A0A094L265_9GAMM|nr:ribosome-associated ATPase/putative transporter RbbA [Pseudidiomarina atlantica]KFZ28723.1 multidrug ABC transporter ATP-binding protein [Pseudidiomarina atlantica]
MNTAAELVNVSHFYGDKCALKSITLSVPAASTTAIIGPDGVGKSTLLGLIAGAKVLQQGSISTLGEDLSLGPGRHRLFQRVAYMPQGLGKNLYPALSVYENVAFFAGLFALPKSERVERIEQLLAATGLLDFAERRAGQLSGGMKQKLGLCCALIHDPDLLLLDEPTTGIDPLSRRQFWRLIERLQQLQPQLSVVVATASMSEAARFEQLVVMHNGEILAHCKPFELLDKTGAESLEQAFLQLLPNTYQLPAVATASRAQPVDEIAIEARSLTKKFGAFTAVDTIDLTVKRGEIFGFLGSNGCGKTTTMKMLTGLLPATSGSGTLLGEPIAASSRASRYKVGYMTQQFSLFNELTVEQNLRLHAQLFKVASHQVAARVKWAAEQFNLNEQLHELPPQLPLGERQRLSLAVAMIHRPEVLILDEPTSGVDPVARELFWQLLIDLAQQQQVTIFISTHYMEEATRCDRISLMHAGKIIVTDTPTAIMAKENAASLDDAFVQLLQRAQTDNVAPVATELLPSESSQRRSPYFSWRRCWSYLRRESMELLRDPIRLWMAALGSVILMTVLGYGMNMDVEDLSFAVLDYDQSQLSHDYTHSIAASRYFAEQSPLINEADMEQRLRSGEISLALELPYGFARDVESGRRVEIGAWIDGSLPMRAETVQGYVQGLHLHWLQQRYTPEQDALTAAARIDTRYRYNPEVKSLPAMMPAVIPLLLLMFPAILTSLAVVREKELGSILNFYVTPTTRLEFLLGKLVPYVVLGMVNYAVLLLLAVYLFEVPLTGSLAALTLASLFYVINAALFGLIISAFVRSQIAALFATTLATIVPAAQFSGLLTPVPSLEGAARWIGEVFPATYHIVVTRGVFSKGMSFTDALPAIAPLVIAIPILLTTAALLLRKQER